MALNNPGFEVIEGGEQPARTEPAPQVVDNGVAIAMLTIGLKALSQRALTAATDLFTLLTCVGAWYLWYSIPEPNDRQIAALTIYAAFTIVINWIVRKK
jgi:hypothetical protein